MSHSMFNYKNSDRFILSRKENDFDLISQKLRSMKIRSPTKANYKKLLEESANQKSNFLYESNLAKEQKKVEIKKVKRTIPSTAERLFDASSFVDDYYLNLLDWGQRNNTLAVGLGARVFLFDGDTCKVSQLVELPEGSTITAVSWSNVSGHLAVGTSDAVVQIWDVEAEKLVRRLKGHNSRVGALSWRGSQLSSGSRSGMLLHQDVNSTSTLASIQAHTQELCGLKWSSDGSNLASGGNDNTLKIWNLNQSHFPNHVLTQHKAAVKALAWCPYEGHSNILASGGGSLDGHIRIWNANTGACVKDIDAQSQVCSLQWGSIDMELISSHGYSKNEIAIWQYPTYEPLAELTGHSARVLHTSLSPDGNRLVSLASDETLRFWRLYNEHTKPRPRRNSSDIKKSLSAFEHPLLR